jgi:prepilin-type N-terminal cleavage/methylation domain-containing protein
MRFPICDLRFTRERTGIAPARRAPFVIRHSSFHHGFTLLEVIVACAIFFMVAFAVLELVTRGLAAAKALQQREPDAGLLAAALSLTNKLEEGTMSGNFEDLAPGLYPGYSWARDAYEVGSNGLFQVDFVVIRQSGKGHGPSETKMSILMYRPGSQQGSRFGGGGGGRP